MCYLNHGLTQEVTIDEKRIQLNHCIDYSTKIKQGDIKMAKLIKILVVCLVASLAILAFAAPAQGNEKESWTEEIDNYISADWLCDFNVTAHQTGKINITYSMDKEGKLSFRSQDGNVKTELYADPDGPHLTAHFQGPFSWQDLVQDGSDWIEKSTGQYQKITVPGYGVAVGRTGNLTIRYSELGVEVIQFSGLFTYDPEGIEAICNYLKP